MKNDVTWKIGGEAGFGIMTSGMMLCKTFSRLGYHILAGNEYPSLIRGGHNVITVRIASQVFNALINSLDILVALNKETVEVHKGELDDGSIVLFDPEDHEWNNSDFDKKITLVAIPLTKITHTLGGEPVMRNMIATGATIALLGTDFSHLESVIRDQFQKKGEETIKGNINVAKSGFDFIASQKTIPDRCFLSQSHETSKQLVMNASEAVGLGALAAGMKFAAIYPMTPINSLINLFADHDKEAGIIYKQPEDEIAGINMAIGASLAGARSMVATSGGGFALMTEGVSLAGIMEVPLVINLGMRPGPATGMPTWTEQGELQFVIHAGHGEFPRIVLAPGDVTESFELTKKAFDLAEYYQTPVFILTDKYLNENLWCVKESVFTSPSSSQKEILATMISSDGSFKRYDLISDNGVSKRSVPGVEYGEYIANSYEHDEKGFTTEEASMRKQMADKRMKKASFIEKEAVAPVVYGDDDSEVTLVGFGSTKNPILEAMNILKQSGKKINFIHFTWVYPMPKELVTKLLSKEKRLIDIEGNSTGQLAAVIREETGIDIKEKLLQYDGRQWSPEEIVSRISKLL